MKTSYSCEEALSLVRQYYSEIENRNVKDIYVFVDYEGRYPDTKYSTTFAVKFKEEIMGKETVFTEHISKKKLTEIFDLIFKKHNYAVEKLTFDCGVSNNECGVLYSVDLIVNQIVKQKVKVRKVSINDTYRKRQCS